MAQYSTLVPDPSKPGSSVAGELGVKSDDPAQGELHGVESDLAELAAKFAAQSGGTLSRELSADLALQIVLNELAEQACLATGATGAAIVLEREGEMVCRASSGSTAPELGARLDSRSGLSGLCIQTRQVQRCDDAQNDLRADPEASRWLGVRSVMVLPLLRNAEVIGVLEVFSSRPSAFGERDERTLEALVQRILKNLARADLPLILPVESALLPVPDADNPQTQSDIQSSVPDQFVHDSGAQATSTRGSDIVTFALAVMVLACAVLLGVLVGERLGWRKARARATPAKTPIAVDSGAKVRSEPGDESSPKSRPQPSTNSAGPPATGKVATSAAGPTKRPDSVVPEGGLRVYENGKEVFRLPPSPGEPSASAPAGVERASSVEPDQVMKLSTAAAEDSLLHRVEPDYPEEARQQQIQGPVVLDVRINPEGGVQELQVVSGQPLLSQAARDAVKQWRFRPRALNGHPVEMKTRITLNFRLPH